jgi:hypothetical protein
LLDELISAARRLPAHWHDRLVSPPGVIRLAARRLFVSLPRAARCTPAWVADAEALLADAFH